MTSPIAETRESVDSRRARPVDRTTGALSMEVDRRCDSLPNARIGGALIWNLVQERRRIDFKRRRSYDADQRRDSDQRRDVRGSERVRDAVGKVSVPASSHGAPASDVLTPSYCVFIFLLMTAKIVLSGRVEGTQLTVLGEGRNDSGKHAWLVRCDCGQTALVTGPRMVSGNTRSCGCLRQRLACVARAALKAGLRQPYSHYPEHNVWQHMVRRCERPSDPAYQDYGGRGITVCCRWRESFAAFITDMGERPTSKHTIDRKNNDGPYAPGNCVWTNRTAQNNNKRDNKRLTWMGRTQTVAEWCRELGLKPFTVYGRLNLGWSTEQTLTTPCLGKKAPRPYYRSRMPASGA